MYRSNDSSKDLTLIHQPKKPLACRLFGCKPSTDHPKLLYVFPLAHERFYSPFILCMCERCGEDIILETKFWFDVLNSGDFGENTVLISLPYIPYKRNRIPYEYIDHLGFEDLKSRPSFKPTRSFSRFFFSLFKKTELFEVFQKNFASDTLIFLNKKTLKLIKTKATPSKI